MSVYDKYVILNLECSWKRLSVASQGVREKLAEAATRSRWHKPTVKY